MPDPPNVRRCPDCGGRGYWLRWIGHDHDGDYARKDCPLCAGTGKVLVTPYNEKEEKDGRP